MVVTEARCGSGDGEEEEEATGELRTEMMCFEDSVLVDLRSVEDLRAILYGRMGREGRYIGKESQVM